jgi:hypothetical protein
LKSFRVLITPGATNTILSSPQLICRRTLKYKKQKEIPKEKDKMNGYRRHTQHTRDGKREKTGRRIKWVSAGT